MVWSPSSWDRTKNPFRRVEVTRAAVLEGFLAGHFQVCHPDPPWTKFRDNFGSQCQAQLGHAPMPKSLDRDCGPAHLVPYYVYGRPDFHPA